MSMRALKKWLVVGVLAAVAQVTSAAWWKLLEDDFSASPTDWIYSGVSNGLGQALFRYDAVNERVTAEWDQGNFIAGFPNDPYVIVNSLMARTLPWRLTDRDTFRLHATLRIASNSIPDTTEFYQLANIGLYGLDRMGPDRTLADDFSGNATLLRNGSDFVEFNYFVNNNSFGFNPNTICSIGGTVTNDTEFVYVSGTGADIGWFHDTDMGAGQYLPVETNLYLELAYYGASTGAVTRRASIALYTEPARTNFVEVNGVPQYYWTQPLPADKSFELTHVAFFNYAAANYGGANGVGVGSWDDVSVERAVSEGEIVASVNPAAPVLVWSAVSGTTYAVVSQNDLIGGPRATQALVTATGNAAGWTNTSANTVEFLFIEPMEP